MSSPTTVHEGRKEACKTYIEQTKLLVALASAFLLAPAGFVAILKDGSGGGIDHRDLHWFIASEVLFVVSVLAGYVVLASIAGSQDANRFDVFRPATRVASVVQLGLYLAGMCAFSYLAFRLLG